MIERRAKERGAKAIAAEDHMTHDQNFKNLILDYPRESLAFFAAKEGASLPPTVRILPVRQEQLKERLGERFRELDIPLLVEWPEGEREGILFVVEEQTEPQRFSLHRLARYCLDLAELMDTDRVVPAVIFLHRNYRKTLKLRGQQGTYLRFSFIACHLARLPAERYFDSDNIVARLNLLNMRYDPKRRVEVYAHAQDGLAALEPDPEKRLKYADFIETYAALDKVERARYRNEYLPRSKQREVIMGLMQQIREEGRQEGRQEGLMVGIELGLELRFGAAGSSLLPEIRQVRDVSMLRKIHEGLRTAATPEELRQIYHHAEK